MVRFILTGSILLLTLANLCICKELYLGTNNSTDTDGCGLSPSFPCTTLFYLLQSCNDGDSVVIEEGVYSNQIYVIVTCENLQITTEGFCKNYISWWITTYSNIIFDMYKNRRRYIYWK